MPTPVRLKGYPASSGVFVGPVQAVHAAVPLSRSAGTAGEEQAKLVAAMKHAAAQVSALVHKTAGHGKKVLEIQLALLEDPELAGPALRDVGRGVAAHVAWSARINAQIAVYEGDEDEQFRARAADIKDIRERVVRLLFDAKSQAIEPGSVVVAEDIAPSTFLEADWSRGGAIVLTAGSSLSHVAMLARSYAIPMVVGIGLEDLTKFESAMVDGGAGLVHFDPSDGDKRAYALGPNTETAAHSTVPKTRLTRSAGRNVTVLANISNLGELARLDPSQCDGIGLARSEFLFQFSQGMPDENQQFEVYRSLVRWAGGKPVTIRTFDAGGDKPISGYTVSNEANPFMGLRGVRLSLARRDVFCTQLRALARAAVFGNLSIMIPMVTTPDELFQTAGILDACTGDLRNEGVSCARPKLGIMVEVPIVAMAPGRFGAADFFSIGTNDLQQYLIAAARDNAAVTYLHEAARPELMNLISGLVDFGKRQGKPVSICGDLAGEPGSLTSLLDTGIAILSVDAARLAGLKQALAGI